MAIYNALANGYGAGGALAVDSSGNLVLFQISAYLQVMCPEIIDSYESQMILVRFVGAMLHSRRVGMKHALP